ncbi:MAG: HEAT repeat domain-containing protein [Candidatus Delongbacteria bacterium]|nr:HEAT repeat domain-containing protein [Candidatus Delongbacteria bacterium]MBN2833813.1 HEAT repeat domain-containing protein [Candidatus Delongbacteria bacterium]
MEKNYKEMIFDYVYDELSLEDRKIVEKIIEENEEYKVFYKEIANGANLLNNHKFEEISDEDLEEERDLLFNKISKVSTNNNISSLFSEIATKIMFYLGNPLKYAAVIAVTIVVSNQYFTKDVETGVVSNTYPLTTAAQNELFINKNPEVVKVSNFAYEKDGENLLLEYELTTKQIVSGKENDPQIISVINKLMENGDNAGIKLKTMKVVDNVKNDNLKKSLFNLMLNDNNVGVRKKAMNLLTKDGIDSETKEALVKLINDDVDPALKIEALTILEKSGEKGARNALELLADDDPAITNLKKAETK